MLAKPKKKKLIILIIIISGFVDTLIDQDELNSAEERVLRLVGQSEFLMNEFDDNEANWTPAQDALWAVVDAIHDAHSPEALSQPTEGDYLEFERDLEDAITNL